MVKRRHRAIVLLAGYYHKLVVLRPAGFESLNALLVLSLGGIGT